MDPSLGARDYAATVQAVRRALRVLSDLPPGASVATAEELAAVADELRACKHGVPATAFPTQRPRMVAQRLVETWPEDDPIRRLVVESARTPLP